RWEWEATVCSIDQNPTASGVRVLSLDTTADRYVRSERTLPYLRRKLSQSDVDLTYDYGSDEAVILRYLFYVLPNLTQLYLRLSGIEDASYFTRLRENPLLSLKILRVQYLRRQCSLWFSACFGLFDAAPSLEEIRIDDCIINPRILNEGLNLPNVRRVRLINAQFFKDDTSSHGTQHFPRNNCPRLRVVECSFRFDANADSELFATLSDMLIALEPVATQLHGLELIVGTGYPPHEYGRIASLAGFSRLEAVSIATEFIEDISCFVRTLPRSVSRLYLHIAKSKVVEFTLNGT
ncbi:hypothetical protein Landi51_13938, partial [Colletotrichum acutatum]